MIEQSALATLLHERLTEWDKARKNQELKLLECYQDVMRIPRDDDTNGTGTSKTRKAKSLFMGSTRNKVRSSRAKINDALFGNGEMPFDTVPENEELAPFADCMEDILTDQMDRMGFKKLLKSGVNALGKYGTGFIFGPFVKEEQHVVTGVKDGVLSEDVYKYDCPYFELANTLDVYPDPEATELEDGLGVFWAELMSPHRIKAWRGQKGYKNIDAALLSPADTGSETGSARSKQLRGNIEYWHEGDRIKVARYFGKIPKHSMTVWNEQTDVHDTTKEANEDELVDAIVIMAGGVIVKVDEKPYAPDYCPALRAVYEEEEHEVWGVGVAENNSPTQKVINAAFRLFMEGKGMALLGTATVDRSKFLPSEDFKKFPGKVYQTKPGLTPEERKDAIIFHQEPDISTGWEEVIRVAEGFSDDDTGINKYTQGDDSRNLNKTAHGISMIMSAGSLPFKEVISNVDESWIVKIVKALIDWNLKYLDVKTVTRIHGEEAGALWAKIKQFGKASFMTWKATGTQSFMQKEVLVSKIQAFTAVAMGNPMTAQLIDARELMNQTWNAMEIGKESPVLKEEGAQQIPPQVQAQIKQLQDALVQAHTEHTQLEQDVKSKAMETQAKTASDERQAQMKAASDERKAEMAEHFATLREHMKADLATALADKDNAVKLEIGDRKNIADIIQVGLQPTPEMESEVDPSM